jgi:hypothetical protein
VNSAATAQRVLTDLGLSPRGHIASGMEGHVFAVGDEKIAKVWHAKRPDEIAELQSFYNLVYGLALPFDTPVIDAVHDTPDGAVSIERKLPGTPLSDVVAANEKPLPAFAIEAVMTVLTALRDHPVRDAQSSLPILGVVLSDDAMVTGSIPMLLGVAEIKADRYGDQLRRSVRDFDWVYNQMVYQLLRLSDANVHAVHGDLCPLTSSSVWISR